jgi:predicted dithiol-disulfide oxidoreductase (DUF899 family)
MKYSDASTRLNGFREQIADLRAQMRDALAQVEPQEVTDYQFTTSDGRVRLSQLFGEQEDLILIHNMGVSCSYCTLWADGYNGVHRHVVSRAAFAVSSPDTPAVQKRISETRGWKFPMVSHNGTTFAADMGYMSDKGSWMPGVSVFRRDGEKIVRVSDAGFHPGDDFCVLWHFFDMLPGGARDWAAVTETAPSCCAQR